MPLPIGIPDNLERFEVTHDLMASGMREHATER